MTEPDFFAHQRAFTAHLRDPQNVPPPAGIDPDRIAVYSNAVYHNIELFMRDNFPRLQEVLSEETWHRVMQTYLRDFESTTSMFASLPQAFLRFLDEIPHPENLPPFVAELAHFECLENLVSIDETRLAEIKAKRDGDPMHAEPVMNPTTQLVQYQFPVHVISADNAPSEPPEQMTNIVAFRDRENRYGFIDVNAATARIVQILLGPDEWTGEQVLRSIAREMNHPNVDAVIDGGRGILARLCERDVILGTL